MSAAVLAFLALTQFGATWDEVSAAVPTPALVVTVSDALRLDGTLALVSEVRDGTAYVVVSPDLLEMESWRIAKTSAHESYHARLRRDGVPYMGLYEEQLANSFAYCWVGVKQYGVVECSSILP